MLRQPATGDVCTGCSRQSLQGMSRWGDSSPPWAFWLARLRKSIHGCDLSYLLPSWNLVRYRRKRPAMISDFFFSQLATFLHTSSRLVRFILGISLSPEICSETQLCWRPTSTTRSTQFFYSNYLLRKDPNSRLPSSVSDIRFGKGIQGRIWSRDSNRPHPWARSNHWHLRRLNPHVSQTSGRPLS